MLALLLEKAGLYTEAERWYRAAAEQGAADAQEFLADMYAQGRGVPQDYGEAAKWFNNLFTGYTLQ